MVDLATEEKEKYKKAWEYKSYRNYSPGEEFSDFFLDFIDYNGGETIYDFGAGTGRATAKFKALGFNAIPIDIADNCLDLVPQMILKNDLVIANLWDELPIGIADFGYCCDVMEHIPPDKTKDVLMNIFKHSKKCFFSICLREDHFGQAIKEHLHLTVRPYKYWKELLRMYGEIIEARDLINNGIFFIEF